ncbi:hypothetical protein L345_15788, partial [Ophiophagus hannah]
MNVSVMITSDLTIDEDPENVIGTSNVTTTASKNYEQTTSGYNNANKKNITRQSQESVTK